MIICGVVLAVSVLIRLAGRNRLSCVGKKMAAVMALMAGLGMAAGAADSADQAVSEGFLERNENGEGDYEEQLQLDAGKWLHNYDYRVNVAEARLTKAEEKQYLEDAKAEIDREFCGENPDVEHIRKRIVIRSHYQDGRVQAEWEFDRAEVIDDEGYMQEIPIPGDGIVVQAAVRLECGSSACCYEICFRVLPEIRSKGEEIIRGVEAYLAQQEEERDSQRVRLPEKMAGQTLYWHKKREYLPEKILLFGVCLIVLFPFLENSKAKEAQKKYDRELMLEYPEMVSRLALLMGAGMTLSAAWNRIAENYAQKKAAGYITEKAVYEEMLRTRYEIQGGIGEEMAYGRFGERCGGAKYRKLGNVLSENLRKGTGGLVNLLEQEAETAFEERKSTARKYGEEAGAKLLFPMIVMLGVIMVILMFPAMYTMQL